MNDLVFLSLHVVFKVNRCNVSITTKQNQKLIKRPILLCSNLDTFKVNIGRYFNCMGQIVIVYT